MPRNQDTIGCTDGLSFNANVTTASAVLVPAPTKSRRSVFIVNRDVTNPIFYNFGKTATAAATTNASLLAGEAIKLDTQNQVWAISTGGTVKCDVTTLEDD